MKRPPQLWIISIGILCVALIHESCGRRATSLIFAKTTTTTTTTEAPSEEAAVTAVSETSTEGNQTVTKAPLTGIPQIDYIWDPNLPFELKGYNLSDYPFYDRVPPEEEINFKCDGLHDGFYASVPHKCQVYHHCLYGTRYDFLCANWTAFDQKTFICHFVSEVDCENSPNFWHRNDALYQAASTAAPSTTTVQTVITPAPVLGPVLSPAQNPIYLPGARRPGIIGTAGRRRRPYRRRRPQYDYYYDDVEEYETDRERDDYYDEPPLRAGGRRRKRPRPNRRPEYDEYEEYEDERYDRRSTGRRDEDRDRRPYRDDDRRYDDRRPATGSKNKDRRVDDTTEERTVESRRKPVDDRRRPSDDDYDRRPSYDRPRKPSRDRYDDKDEDRRSNDRPRKPEDDKTERRPYDRNRKPDDDDRRYRPKDPKPLDDEKDDRRSYDRPRKPLEDDNRRYRPKEAAKPEERTRPVDDVKPLVRPSGSSVYDRPRASPIIRRPLTKSEQSKYGKPTSTSKPVRKEPEDEEYYDDYEDDPRPPPPKTTRKPIVESRDSDERRASIYARTRRPPTVRKPVIDEVEEEVKRPAPKRPSERSRFEPERIGSGSKKQAIVEEEYDDEYEEEKPVAKAEPSSRGSSKFSSKESRESTTAKVETTTRESRERPEPVVRVVKRPFLPSRGGNPYSARGLQPVGSKALDDTLESLERPQSDEAPKKSSSESQVSEEPDQLFLSKNVKPASNEENISTSSENTRQPAKSSEKPQQSEEEQVYEDEPEYKPFTSRPKTQNFKNDLPRTTQKPKVTDNYRNPLDINENEYDVTLNDALNPTLPNLPIRSVPTGFSSGREGYIAQNYQRPRLVAIESSVLSPASSDYVYQVKQPQQSARYNPYVTVQQLNNYRHPSTASGQYYTTYE